MTSYLLILALLLGLAPGFIAHGKGRNFLFWWVYGVVLGPIALIHAIMLRGGRRAPLDEPPRPREREWDSPWPMLLRIAASIAILIVAVAAYRFLVPSDSGGTRPQPDVVISSDRTPPELPAAPGKVPVEGVPPTAAPAVRTPPSSEPAPNVRVTVRRDTPQTGDGAANSGAGSPKPEAGPSRDGASAPDTAPVPQPPDAAPQQLERTLPAEPKPAPKPSLAPVKEVDVLAARPAPPPDRAETAERSQKQLSIAARPGIPPAKPAIPEKKSVKRAVAARSAAAPEPKPDRLEIPSLANVTAMGEMVQAVQQALNERGYDAGPANGLAGPQTEVAIRKFQADRRLNPTGTIDYALLEALNIVGPRIYPFQTPPGVTPGR